jgi:hypothetical protein
MVKQAMARHGIVPIDECRNDIRILLSWCFSRFHSRIFCRNYQTECITEFPPYRRGSFCRWNLQVPQQDDWRSIR